MYESLIIQLILRFLGFRALKFIIFVVIGAFLMQFLFNMYAISYVRTFIPGIEEMSLITAFSISLVIKILFHCKKKRIF